MELDHLHWAVTSARQPRGYLSQSSQLQLTAIMVSKLAALLHTSVLPSVTQRKVINLQYS